MRYDRTLGYWEPKYLKNDRVYVDITKDGFPWDYISFGITSYKKREFKSAKILESDEHYVKALVDGGDLIIVAKRHAKPVISSNRVLIIEPTNYPEKLFINKSQKKCESQKKKFSIWYLPPFVFLLFVLVAIFWRCQ